ncbi:lanthionine synthetase C family protein [Georgenia thermotolerans]|uniref:Lanthionine synthetase n=1 Tax=Georgenia thermotolerans TaxID=527326 RepID=A0A7J5UMD5_9MICO|nr:lanthionine synthetase C family protein [Georgenia thermotolerans]KAE8763441.1 hypothetical protein GB883_14055 [Georgenia thermotolerans]
MSVPSVRVPVADLLTTVLPERPAEVMPLTRRSAVHVTSGRGERDAVGGLLPWARRVGERRDRVINLADAGRRHQLVASLAGGIAAAAQLDTELLAGDPPPPAQALGFSHGMAGVLWALAEVGAHVPDALVTWLAEASDRAPLGPGLAQGRSGLALALDALGDHDAAARQWAAVELTDPEDLGLTLADGLAGVGLALLERAPIRDGEALLARVETLARALADQLREEPRMDRLGLMRGGAGAALFLLHVYDLTEDESLLAPIEQCLRHDLAMLGWGSFGRHAALPLWLRPGSLSEGSIGVGVVLHQAMQHLDAPWVAQAAADITEAAEIWLLERPGLSRGRAGAVLALQYLRSHPWETAEERFARMRPFLEPLTVHGSALGTEPSTPLPLGLEDGAAGILLALGHLGMAGDRRLPFFW